MLARRNSGLVSLHQAIIACEAALLWVLLSHSGIRFTTLLPLWVYPFTIILGIIMSTNDIRGYRHVSGVQRLNLLDSLQIAIRQTAFTCGSVFTVVVLLKDPGISRLFLLVYFCSLVPFLIFLNRHQPRWIAWRFLFKKEPVPVLMIGSASRFPNFANWLLQNQRVGMVPIGVLIYRDQAVSLPDIPLLGDFDNLDTILAQNKVGLVVMLDQPDSKADAEKLIAACLAFGTRLLIHNNFGYKLGYPLQLVTHENYSFLTLHDEPLEDPLKRGLKRGLDIVVSLFALSFILPPLVLWVWIMQRRESPGPLFHAQLRTGHNRSRFMILKFRTMHVSNEDPNRQAVKDDERIFSFGRFLRQSSLDEFPQFFNVLRGEMSTVGPRPHLLAHSDTFSRELDVYLLRYFAKPGITGLAQCNGFRGPTSAPDMLRGRVHLDFEYIRNWSLWLDLVIIVKTARQVIFPPAGAH